MRQTSSDGNAPFQVAVKAGVVQDARGGVVFSNDGGSLTLEEVTFLSLEGTDIMSLVSMGGQATTIANDIEITGGSITVCLCLVFELIHKEEKLTFQTYDEYVSG